MSVRRRLNPRNELYGVFARYPASVASRFRPGDDGWHQWVDDNLRQAAVHVRVDEGDDGRLHLAGLRVEGKVSAELLRSIPVGRIEAAANAQLHVSAPPVPARRPPVRIAAIHRLSTDRGYPVAFYRRVATSYRHLAMTSKRPVADLAAANDVPVSTAQRWVKEARRRNLLAPGRPGKAG